MFANPVLFYPAIFLVGYLIGSVPFGYFIGRLYGKDIRTLGSGNIGATNVTRCIGKIQGKICFALDFLKGFLPLLALRFALRAEVVNDPWKIAFIVLICAVVLGHMFTVFLGFKGGKGISTAAGACCAVAPLAVLIALALWCLVVVTTGYVSLGSILAAAMLPVAALILTMTGVTATPLSMQIFLFALGAAAIYKHRENIGRLCNGTESSFKHKKD